MRKTHQLALLKAVIHIAALSPLIWTFYLAAIDDLGGDPVKALIHFSGIAALNMLLITLCVSPLAKYLKQGWLVQSRRLLGLYAFFFACCHISAYLVFDLQLEWGILWADILKRPYITVGAAAWLILLALALSSPKRIQRRMGKSWQTLHNWVYVGVILAAVHYYWSVKSDITQPLLYFCFVLFLLRLRLPKLKRWWNRHQRSAINAQIKNT